MANLLKMAVSETIRTLHRRGWSQRRIADELGINRETVARHLRRADPTSKPANAPPGSEEGDGRVVPEIDSTDSPVAKAVPDTVDFTGPTGPGPLLPAGTIGTPLGDVRVSDDAGETP